MARSKYAVEYYALLEDHERLKAENAKLHADLRALELEYAGYARTITRLQREVEALRAASGSKKR